MSTTNNRTLNQFDERSLASGLQKNAQKLSSLFIHGTAMPVADLVALLQKRIDSGDHVTLSRAAWLQSVREDGALREETHALVMSIRQALQAAFANSTDTLAEYGLKPRRTRTRTAEQQVAAAAKAKATRAARHTMGSKQRAQIKGTVEVPVTSTAASTAPKPVA
jgi:hypothetical protein